jgi:NADPH2:quinone reductase
LNGERIDASFNSIAGKTIKKDMQLLGAGGRLVIFGAASRVGSGALGNLKLAFRSGIFSPLSMIMNSKSIIGVNILRMADHKPQAIARALGQVVAMAETGRLDPVVRHSFKADELEKAHLTLEQRGSIGKVAVKW